MKPNDKKSILPVDKRAFRVLIIKGSGKKQYNCTGVGSKARVLGRKMAVMLPVNLEIDYENLNKVYGRIHKKSCNACVSTSMAICLWRCNCYKKSSWAEPDFMCNADRCARHDVPDAWAVIRPVNWYAPASNVKLMFDRLVCMNGGNTDEKLMSHKDPEKAIALEKSEQWKELMINHPEGITTGFFCYSHHGNNELDNNNLPRILDYKNYFNGAPEPFQNMRQANAPGVWQCRYGNIKVPENVWPYADSGVGRKYSDDQSGAYE